MKESLLIVICSILFTGSIISQEFPEELLGEWHFEQEINLCYSNIENGCGIEKLIISQYENNSKLDTLTITEVKSLDESFSARYHLTFFNENPDLYQFTHIDSVPIIQQNELFDSYLFDSLPFNWTTTDVVLVYKMFELINEDSLIFHWFSYCQACHCGAEIHFSRIEPSSNSEIKSDSNWKIFPNPAKKFISLEKVNKIYESDISISLFSANGRIVNEIETSETQIRINTDAYQDGLYLLRIKEDKGVSIKKVIIEK
jgi:hypothetical protein